MALVTIYSEPLIEKFGRGFSAEEQAMSSCSGDALNIAGATSRVLKRLADYKGDREQHTVSVLCGLGDDDYGRAIKHFMREEGTASSDHALTLPSRHTASYTIHREEGGTKRSVEYHNRGHDSAMCQLFEANPLRVRREQTMRAVENKADILVITGIGASRARSDAAFDKLVAMASEVKRHGGTVIVDLNHRFHADTGAAKLWLEDDDKTPKPNPFIRERMDRLFALADIAFVAHDELQPIYGNLYNPPLQPKQDAPNAAPIVAHLRSLPAPDGCKSPRHIVFKRGRDGGQLHFDNGFGQPDSVIETVNSQVDQKKIVDRNGGGDALIGGTIAGLLRGYTLDQSLNIGQLMAGKVIQHSGGVLKKEFLPSDEELSQMITEPQTPYVFSYPSGRRASGGRDVRPSL